MNKLYKQINDILRESLEHLPKEMQKGLSLDAEENVPTSPSDPPQMTVEKVKEIYKREYNTFMSKMEQRLGTEAIKSVREAIPAEIPQDWIDSSLDEIELIKRFQDMFAMRAREIIKENLSETVPNE